MTVVPGASLARSRGIADGLGLLCAGIGSSSRSRDPARWRICPVHSYRANVDPNIDDEALSRLCRRYGIAKLWVFGSVARGTQGSDSDLDLLYELQPGAHLGWEITELRDELSRLFARPVDLVSRRSIHPMLREAVLREAKALHAA